MPDYKNKQGILYTQEEIEAVALENGVDIEKVIADNGLTPEDGGKQKSVVAQEPTTAQKPKEKKPASSTKKPSSASSGKKKYPWAEEKKQPGFLDTFKQDKKAKEEQAKYDQSMREELDYMRETEARKAAGLSPAPPIGSFGRTKFEQDRDVQIKKAEEKKIKEEEEVIKLKAIKAEYDLKYNKEASEAYKEALAFSSPDDFDYENIDNEIQSKLNPDISASPVVPGMKSKEVDRRVGGFDEEIKKVKTRLKANGTLGEYSEDQILDLAVEDYRAKRVEQIKKDKFKNYLEDNTNLSEEAKSIVTKYGELGSQKAAINYVEAGTALTATRKNQERLYKQIESLSQKLRPKDYKYTTQEEVDEENALISNLKELAGYYKQGVEAEESLYKDTQKYSQQVEDLSLLHDMFKRDYSWVGWGKERGKKLISWAETGLAVIPYLATRHPLAQEVLEATGLGENGVDPITMALMEAKRKNDEWVAENAPKDFEETSIEGTLEHTSDLVFDFLPDLVLMLYSGGSSKATMEGSKQAVKKTLAKRALSAVSLNRQTLPLAMRVAGDKYLQMVEEEKYGYYDEDGNFIKPEYSYLQETFVPAAFGYTEGVFEKVTGKILNRGGQFFKQVRNTKPEAWANLSSYTGKKILEKTKYFAQSQLEEGVSEQLTNIGQNAIDKFLLGKNVNLFDNTGVVFKDTALLTTVLTGVPIVGSSMVKQFMSESASSKISNNARELAVLRKQLAQPDISEIQRKNITNKIEELNSQTSELIGKAISNIGTMPVSLFNDINSLNSSIADILNKADEIKNSDSKTKTEDLEALNKEYISTKFKLNSILNSIDSINRDGKPISGLAKARIMALAANKVKALTDPSVDQSISRDQAKKIDERIEQIYKEEGVDLKEVREKEFADNLKAAENLAKNTDTTIVVGEDSADLKSKVANLLKEGLITGADAAEVDAMLSEGAEGMFSLNEKFLFMDKASAIKNKAVTVASHEFLHKLLAKSLKNAGIQTAVGKALQNFLLNSNPELFLTDSVIGRLEANYGERSESVKAEELLTILSDALLKGQIKYNESFFVKLGDTIRRFLQDVGLISIKFDSGRDVFNFIRDYNNTVQKGKDLKGAMKKALESGIKGELTTTDGEARTGGMMSKSIEERMNELDQQLSDNEIDYDTYDKKMEALEIEEAEMKRKEYEEKKAAAKAPEKKAEAKPVEKKPTKQKEPSEISTAAEKAKAKLDAIGNDPKGFNPNNPVIYDELEKMVKAKSRNWRTAKGTIIDFTNKDKGGLDGFDIDEMASYVIASMIPYIKKFDPSKNNSLYGYINSQYINRMKAALKSGQVANVVFTEDVTEMKKLSEEDVEVTKPSLPERKRFQNILESGVFAPEVIDEIQKKIIPIVRTLKTKIDEKVSINRTVAPIIDEIRLAMGSQADIDIKKAMGGKEGGMLTKWLLTNKKTILENMTTTWLMGKDGKGGMPFAIQKRINGQWVNYPDWVGKKIDRESVDVDLAGRTAGHEMVRRLPNVNNNVDNDTFLSAIVDIKDGTPLRGRKEALAKAMAEELSFDLISDDFANEGPIFQAFQRNQEMLGAALEKVTKEEVNRLAERGNIKYSLSAEYAAALEDVKAYDRLSKEEKSKLLDPYSDPKSSISKAIAKIYNELNDDDPEAIKLRTNWDNYIRSKKGLYWKLHEAVIGNRLKRYNNYSVMNYGGNNPNVADVVIAKTRKIARKVNKVFVEIKKAADTLIPITSATANVVIDKFANKETFDKLSEKSQNAVKKIKELQNGLKNNFKLSNLTEFTRTGNAKLSAEDLVRVKDILGGKRKKVESLPIGIDLVKLFNNKKYHPNDIIIIKERAFDYFNGYTGFDTFENVFKNFNIDNLENNLFVLNIEYQINTSGNLTIRTYLNFNEAIKTADGKIVNAIDVINNHVKEYGSNSNAFTDENIEKVLSKKSSGMYSKSLENNLNSFKGINNIDLISKYVSENNLKRISAEDSFDILNDLAKEIENYWGILPDNIITMMNRTVDYAFDVIEDRENEGGPLMAALNNALNLETIKNAETQLNQFIDNNRPKTSLKFSKSLDYDFNDMLERNKGIASYEKVSDIVAKRKGAKIRNFSFFIPPSAEDFRGLTTYVFSGKGKQGELDQQFFDNNLVIPYVKGISALDSVRQSIKKAYKELLDDFPDIKKRLEKVTPDKDFTYDQAIRVYLWNKNNIDVPGLSRRDKNKLVYFVKSDGDLLAFAEALSLAGRQDGGWMEPSDTWDSETIISDLHNITEGEGRKKWLAEFIENADAIFSKENLNKIQSIYGTSLRIAIEDSLYRMKNGKNRPEGADRLTNAWMNWINGATSTIMFFNTRSALLQTISSTNFLNWTDNNPLKAGMAFANQKQYWTDFAMIINSDKLRERRAGLKSDVSQAEIANAANSAKNKAAGVISYLQKIGFTPTQAADSFAIAIGGAAFYRNRLNTYLKQADEDGNLINTQEEAEAKAWTDFSKATDESQQSADPMYISKQQTTSLGRLVLAFANTPMQYNRIIKKAALDLVNKRGNWKTNMSKIIYYGALQNIIFSALQAALFLPFEDEDEEALAKMTKEERKEYDKLVEKQNNKTISIANGMLDTVLRGSGITGAVIATLKNIAITYKQQEDRKHFADHAQTFLAGAGIMPPVSSKLRKAYNIHRTNKFDKDVIEEMGWDVTRDGKLNLSPRYGMIGSAVSVTTNIPLDRLVEKTENVAEALDSRNSAIQRVALFLGWKEWELNVKNEEQLEIKEVAKAKRKEEGIQKAIETRRKKKEAKEAAYKAMSMEEKREYNRQLTKEKIAKKKKKIEEKKKEALEKRKKRRMG